MKFVSIVFASAFLIACGGGSSSSSSGDKNDQSQSSGQVDDSSVCQVNANKIEITEGKSCTLSADTVTTYRLFFNGEVSCTGGKIVTTGLTAETVNVNGLAISCK
ncbi:MAG: hypothetical protein MK185_15640 [Saccharospirillaceae bacterium]|nr:hypothetical protein [Saccharospirillaceae bacterium]